MQTYLFSFGCYLGTICNYFLTALSIRATIAIHYTFKQKKNTLDGACLYFCDVTSIYNKLGEIQRPYCNVSHRCFHMGSSCYSLYVLTEKNALKYTLHVYIFEISFLHIRVKSRYHTAIAFSMLFSLM